MSHRLPLLPDGLVQLDVLVHVADKTERGDEAHGSHHEEEGVARQPSVAKELHRLLWGESA